jgi:hypothetical protein
LPAVRLASLLFLLFFAALCRFGLRCLLLPLPLLLLLPWLLTLLNDRRGRRLFGTRTSKGLMGTTAVAGDLL